MKKINIIFIVITLFGCISKQSDLSVINKQNQLKFSYHEKNQVELMKQWIGKAKVELSEDTTIVGASKSYGTTGIEAEYAFLVKGVPIKEVKEFYVYDSIRNIIVEVSMTKNGGIEMFALRFTSPTEYTRISYNDISIPEKANSYMLGEMISKDTILETWYLDNNPVYSHMWIKVH